MSEGDPSGFRAERSADPAIDALARAFYDQGTPPAPGEEPAAPPPPAEEAPAVEEPEVAEEPEIAEEEPEAPEGEEEAAEGEELHTVKVDGVEAEVPYSELVRGYQTAQALTRRGESVAQDRRELEGERAAFATEMAQGRASLAQLTQQFEVELAAMRPDPAALNALRESDPGEWSARVQEMQRRDQMLQYAHAEQQRAAEAELYQTIQREKASLRDRAPEFAADFEGEFDALKQWATSPSGGELPVELFNQVTDHRALLLMRDAKRYRDAVKKAPQTRQKVKAKPRVKAASTPREPGAAGQEAYAAAMANLQQNQESRDALHAAFLAKERMRGGGGGS